MTCPTDGPFFLWGVCVNLMTPHFWETALFGLSYSQTWPEVDGSTVDSSGAYPGTFPNWIHDTTQQCVGLHGRVTMQFSVSMQVLTALDLFLTWCGQQYASSVTFGPGYFIRIHTSTNWSSIPYMCTKYCQYCFHIHTCFLIYCLWMENYGYHSS